MPHVLNATLWQLTRVAFTTITSLTAIMSDFPCIRKGKYRPAATVLVLCMDVTFRAHPGF